MESLRVFFHHMHKATLDALHPWSVPCCLETQGTICKWKSWSSHLTADGVCSRLTRVMNSIIMFKWRVFKGRNSNILGYHNIKPLHIMWPRKKNLLVLVPSVVCGWVDFSLRLIRAQPMIPMSPWLCPEGKCVQFSSRIQHLSSEGN